MAETDGVWIERFGPGALRGEGAGSLVAVKDLIDVAGSVTTAGCRAVAENASPAETDADCIVALRAAGVRLAGKVSLHELAYGITGVNPWYGTPANPSDPGRIPGGSSSGSAVAVARREVDWALGTDTGGSVRIPAACCGVVGLKTTHGRIPLGGVWPLAPSFDTIGPLARDVAGIVTAMAELEGGFEPGPADPRPLGRLRIDLGERVAVDPVIEAALDDALRAAELIVEPAELPGWLEAWGHQQALLGEEAFQSDGHLLEGETAEGVGEPVRRRLADSQQPAAVLESARAGRERFGAAVEALLEHHAALVLPTLPMRPFPVEEVRYGLGALCSPVNLLGLPAITLPVPAPGRPPTGLQLVGARGAEERLVAIAALIEAAVGS